MLCKERPTPLCSTKYLIILVYQLSSTLYSTPIRKKSHISISFFPILYWFQFLLVVLSGIWWCLFYYVLLPSKIVALYFMCLMKCLLERFKKKKKKERKKERWSYLCWTNRKNVCLAMHTEEPHWISRPSVNLVDYKIADHQ